MMNEVEKQSLDTASEKWTSTVVEIFNTQGIHFSGDARSLFSAAFTAQINEGIVRDHSELTRILARIDLDNLPKFYIFKFGRRPVTFNRAVRLLADLHDVWIRLRKEASLVHSPGNELEANCVLPIVS